MEDFSTDTEMLNLFLFANLFFLRQDILFLHFFSVQIPWGKQVFMSCNSLLLQTVQSKHNTVINSLEEVWRIDKFKIYKLLFF